MYINLKNLELQYNIIQINQEYFKPNQSPLAQIPSNVYLHFIFSSSLSHSLMILFDNKIKLLLAALSQFVLVNQYFKTSIINSGSQSQSRNRSILFSQSFNIMLIHFF
ncbi:hypothetical protein ABPG72_003651 [Tetrahymena utriculariae]